MESLLARKQMVACLGSACAIAVCALFGLAAALSALTASCAVAAVDYFYAKGVLRVMRERRDPLAAIRLRAWRMLGILLAFALGIQLLASVGEPVPAALLAGLALPLLCGEAYAATAARRL